jgi:hypothetical protein
MSRIARLIASYAKRLSSRGLRAVNPIAGSATIVHLLHVHAVLPIDLRQANVHEAILSSAQNVSNMVRLDRQLSTATVDQDCEFDRCGAPKAEKVIHGGTNRPSRPQYVVHEDDPSTLDG